MRATEGIGSLVRRARDRFDDVVIEAPAVATAGAGSAGTSGRTARRLGGAASLRPSRTVPVVAVALAATVGLVVVNTGADDGPGPGEALVVVDGEAAVWRSEGGREIVRDRTRLGPGDRLAVRRGSADLELADEVTYQAVAAAGGVPATEIEMDVVPRLRSGSLLVEAPVASTLRSGPGEVALVEGAVARVARTTAVSVGVYRGSVVVGSAGAERTVGALRSAEVVGDGEVSGSRPLTYRAGDDWDRRYLAPALALDRQLDPLLGGFTAGRLDPEMLAQRLRGEVAAPPSAAALRAIVTERDDVLDAAIGIAVAGSSTSGPFDERWDRAIGFRDAGAAWGLVAMDLGVAPDDVIDALAVALEATPVVAVVEGLDLVDADGDGVGDADGPGDGAAAPDAGDGEGTAGDGAVPEPPGPADGGAVAPGPSPTTGAAPAPAPAPTGSPSPAPAPTLPPPPAPLAPVTSVVGAVDDVTGGLVTDVTTGVGGTLAPITGPITGSGGLLGPVTGSGGLLGPVTGSGGLLPLE